MYKVTWQSGNQRSHHWVPSLNCLHTSQGNQSNNSSEVLSRYWPRRYEVYRLGVFLSLSDTGFTSDTNWSSESSVTVCHKLAKGRTAVRVRSKSTVRSVCDTEWPETSKIRTQHFSNTIQTYCSMVTTISLVSCGGGRLSPLGTSATGLLYQPRMIDGECREVCGMRIGRGNRSTRSKPASVPLCPP
jgi:hypothetical protein